MLSDKDYESIAEGLRRSGDMDDKYSASFVRSSASKDWHVPISGGVLEKSKQSVPKFENNDTIPSGYGDFGFKRE